MEQDQMAKKENLIKNVLSNKIFLSLLFFAMGVSADWALHQYRGPGFKHTSALAPQVSENLNDIWNDWNEPFKTLKEQTGLLEDLKNTPQISEIKKHEDDHYIYYDIDLKNFEPQKLDVTVNNRNISISGQVEHKEQKEGLNRYSSSSFQRSFPVPENADPRSYKMEQQNGKIILKFSKSNKTENS